MFTGLIEAQGTVLATHPGPAGLRLIIRPDTDTPWANAVTAGESIAVQGVCLTARHPDQVLPHGTPLSNPTNHHPAPAHPNNSPNTTRDLAFDVIAETLARTTLARLTPGRRVNLERAIRADTLLGGHFVQGHVDSLARVAAVQPDPADWRVTLEIPEDLMPAMIPKGSIAIDGVSLTLAAVHQPTSHTPDTPGTIEVALIPTTLQRTTLAELTPGDHANIEADMLAKAVVNTVRRMAHTLQHPPR